MVTKYYFLYFRKLCTLCKISNMTNSMKTHSSKNRVVATSLKVLQKQATKPNPKNPQKSVSKSYEFIQLLNYILCRFLNVALKPSPHCEH